MNRRDLLKLAVIAGVPIQLRKPESVRFDPPTYEIDHYEPWNMDRNDKGWWDLKGKFNVSKQRFIDDVFAKTARVRIRFMDGVVFEGFWLSGKWEDEHNPGMMTLTVTRMKRIA